MENIINVFRFNKRNKIIPYYETKVCFITAIYGKTNALCKKYKKQTIPTDFICFTDDSYITPNDWIIDTTDYHNREIDEDDKNNNNMIVKYYKQSFQQIPRLKKYDIIVWVDETVEIVYKKTSEYLLRNIQIWKIIWDEPSQSIQDLTLNYEMHVEESCSDEFVKDMKMNMPFCGVWVTRFVAFANKDPDVTKFLEMWYSQATLEQVGFHYAAWKTKIEPRQLHNNKQNSEIVFYIKNDR